MTTDRNNETNGVFDIQKEARIVAGLVVGTLAHAGIISDKDLDRAIELAEEEILVRRSMESL